MTCTDNDMKVSEVGELLREVRTSQIVYASLDLFH